MSAAAERAKIEASSAQLPAADPNGSVWVEASAGTGKTKVLTDRVLSLMLHGTAPARILCLTFTKAAAAEMANRLAQRLTRWAIAEDAELAVDVETLLGRRPDGDMLAVARQLFARVLDAPGGMKIQTIHAFCQSLLGRFPLEAGIAPHFQVLDARSAEEMLHQAREEVLAGASGEAETAPLAGAIGRVSVHAQDQSFRDLLKNLIAERTRLARLIQRHGGIEGLEAAVFRALDVDPVESAEDALISACGDSALDLMGLRLICEALDNGTEAESKKAAALRAWVAAGASVRAAGFDRYQGLFLTREGNARARLLTKGAEAAVSGALAVMQAEAARLIELRARVHAIIVARATGALLHVGHAIVEAYARHKRDRALLDYDDLIVHACDLLQGQDAASWVLFKLDGGLDHILIDEAQDTNPEQWEVIRLLAEEFFTGEGAREGPRTVFAVGDAKQSIYSFQRADPSAFGRMRAHFAERAEHSGQRLATVGLAHSFRSTAAVLKAVDAVFAHESMQDGVVFGGGPLAHTPIRLGQAGLVELWPPAEPPEAVEVAPWEPPVERRAGAPARTRLAGLIARKIWLWSSIIPTARWTSRSTSRDCLRAIRWMSSDFVIGPLSHCRAFAVGLRPSTSAGPRGDAPHRFICAPIVIDAANAHPGRPV